ncbi:MAG: response regulator transcription factor [Anaerovoracaceae bacterium]
MIGIVEDDKSIREVVCYTLNNTGFTATGFSCGSEFFDFTESQVPELLLLDIMLPGEDGLGILQKIRSNPRTENMPVILLTAKDTEYDKIMGLDNGADDYVTKPFGMMELVSRIKAVLRRMGTQGSNDIYVYKDICLDATAHVVKVMGERVELTLKEFSTLKVLIESKGAVVNRDYLLRRVWGYDFDGETRTVDVHIRTLRTKLGVGGKYIKTVRGVGYRIGGADE